MNRICAYCLFAEGVSVVGEAGLALRDEQSWASIWNQTTYYIDTKSVHFDRLQVH